MSLVHGILMVVFMVSSLCYGVIVILGRSYPKTASQAEKSKVAFFGPNTKAGIKKYVHARCQKAAVVTLYVRNGSFLGAILTSLVEYAMR